MLFLAGGGDEQDSILLDKVFSEHLLNKKLLYFPFAMNGSSPTFEQCEAWIKSIFIPLGISEVIMWEDLSKHSVSELKQFDAIYIGGGNTYRLLHHLRETGFDCGLLDFINDGGLVYGGSAGAIILGYDISTAETSDTNEVGLVALSGLNLLGKYAIWCHYTNEHDHIISNYNFPIIAIPERSGIIANNSVIEVVGFENIIVFKKGEKKILLPNESMMI